MKDEIEHILQAILGLPLWSIGRAGDLEWFLFGSQRRIVSTRGGETKVVSDFALHVQCAWRIRNKNRIVTGSRDRFYPPGEYSYQDLEEFEWDIPGGNLLDMRISKLLEEKEENPFVVISIQADEVGSVNFFLSDGYSLEIFPDDSLSSEYWRFFIPYDEKEHFVITGHGIERE
jgi:hypothetical protein